MITISCIYWTHGPAHELNHEFTGKYVFTSVDLILLLEKLTRDHDQVLFSVKEKNRIRRNRDFILKQSRRRAILYDSSNNSCHIHISKLETLKGILGYFCGAILLNLWEQSYRNNNYKSVAWYWLSNHGRFNLTWPHTICRSSVWINKIVLSGFLHLEFVWQSFWWWCWVYLLRADAFEKTNPSRLNEYSQVIPE